MTNPSNRFALLEDTLVVLSDTSLRLVGQDGEDVWSVPIRMSAPALECAGGSGRQLMTWAEMRSWW